MAQLSGPTATHVRASLEKPSALPENVPQKMTIGRLLIFPVTVHIATSQFVPPMGEPIPVDVWLVVWDSKTNNMSLATAIPVTHALT
ncbi:hypothetical protein ATANTOWER_004511 [Ataeniobius toweri]|uniref:Uncharacterized protein n=1 Tax=Ataeniobius toweri TaxID=208326 RepID=A0ABU7A4R2_9TELE|nr:hypothetical protein [Ataeniobius toweri]